MKRRTRRAARTRRAPAVKAPRPRPEINWERPLEGKRMHVGTAFRGPEYYGCINSGARPYIYRSQIFDGFFLVGPEGEVETVLRLRFDKRVQGKRKIVLDKKSPKACVYVFKTRKPAEEKFTALCAAVLTFNAEERGGHAAAIADARSGDPRRVVRGAANLLDY